MVTWQQSDLEARLCRALDIAKRTVSFFALTGFKDGEASANNFGSEKPIAETAMLLYSASAVRRLPNVAGRVDEVARLLVPHARSDRVRLEIALHPSLAFVFAVPHVLLTKLGYPDPGFDVFLKACVTSQARNGHERPPFASLERRWISSLWTGQKPGRGWRADLLNSVLNWPVDILGGFRDDAYALTHLFMYCTDFGFQNRRLPRCRSVIMGEARSLLARYLDAEDYDLAGEILLAWPLSGAAWCPSASFGFAVLARVEDCVGVLPCGNTKVHRLNQLKGEERARYALATGYHTAYVMGFLCAASLRPNRGPPVRITGPRFDKSCLERLLGFIERDQGHWQAQFSELVEAEQLALTPFLLDLAIVQKSRKHDYNAMSELLALACQYQIADSPLCGQAAELLERLAACSNAITGSSYRLKGSLPEEPEVREAKKGPLIAELAN